MVKGDWKKPKGTSLCERLWAFRGGMPSPVRTETDLERGPAGGVVAWESTSRSSMDIATDNESDRAAADGDSRYGEGLSGGKESKEKNAAG